MGRNGIINYVLGGRGIGKTYFFKRWCIKDFINTGHQFVWIRRYKEELAPSKLSEFLEDIIDKFPNHDIKIDGKKLMIDKQHAGTFIVLSTSTFYKSVSFPSVNKIIFDEFTLEKGLTRYLNNEVHILLNLMSTITRFRPPDIPLSEDVRIFMLGNTVSLINPHFDYFKLYIKSEVGIQEKNGVYVEICDSERYRRAYAETRHGQVLKNTPFYDYAINNNPYADQSNFIKDFSVNKMKFLTGIVYEGFKIGVWHNPNDFNVYFSRSCPATNKVFVINQEDHSMNTMWLKNFKKINVIKGILQAYSVGLVVYQDTKVMHVMNQIFSMINS